MQLNELRWALLFHDAIYDPQRKDNELRSAEWACATALYRSRCEAQAKSNLRRAPARLQTD